MFDLQASKQRRSEFRLQQLQLVLYAKENKFLLLGGMDHFSQSFFSDTIFVESSSSTLVWAEYMNLNVVGTPLAELEGLDASATPMTSSTAPVGAKAKTYKKVESQPQSQPVDPADALLQKALESSSSLRFLYGPTLPMKQNSGPRSEWDFRASMEKRRRMERERAAWLEENARNVGRFSAVASDWRNDVRITDTGNPKDPEYREWTLREIWDMINLSGVSLDPRDVPFKATQPGSTADCVAEGFIQEPEIPEWLAQQGRIIEEDDENDIIDRDAEALLGSEFSDFEDFSPGDSVLGDPIEDGLILDQF